MSVLPNILAGKWKLFAISSSLTFLMVILPAIGLHFPKLISPAPNQPDKFDQVIQPKLDQKVNTFTLSKPISLVGPVSAAGQYDQAKAYLVMNYKTGHILAEKNGQTELPIASLTKIMSAVVALDLANKDELITVPQSAAEVIPTRIGVIPGEQMSVEDLLNASLLTSANDAMQVLNDGINQQYNLPNHPNLFVDSMNAKSGAIGLKNSHFTNPQGFDDSHPFSTVEDLAVLSHYALENYPLIDEIAAKSYDYLPADQNHKKFDLYNWNGLMNVYPGVRGLKIGNTDDAGYTTVTVADRNGSSILVVVLGAPGILERDLWAGQLLDLGFKQVANLPEINITEAELHQKYKTWQYGDDLN